MKAKKSESVNLENKRTIFLEIGMIITLILILSAFNWKTYEKKVHSGYQRDFDDTPSDLVPITVQKLPEPPVPKKPARQ